MGQNTASSQGMSIILIYCHLTTFQLLILVLKNKNNQTLRQAHLTFPPDTSPPCFLVSSPLAADYTQSLWWDDERRRRWESVCCSSFAFAAACFLPNCSGTGCPTSCSPFGVIPPPQSCLQPLLAWLVCFSSSPVALSALPVCLVSHLCLFVHLSCPSISSCVSSV